MGRMKSGSPGGADPAHPPYLKWSLKDRPDPLRKILMGAYMGRAIDVIDFYEFLARTVRIPLIGKYFFKPIINLYGAKYHSGRATPLRDVLPLLAEAKSLAVSECSCRARMGACSHSTRTCLKINTGAEVEERKGQLKSERVDAAEAARIVSQAFDDGLMLQVEWCIEPYTYCVCCCCECCCVTRRLRFDSGIESGVSPSEYLAEIDAAACSRCGACERLCPGRAITIPQLGAGDPSVREKDCVGCGLCERHCPTGAISLRSVRPPAVARDRGWFHHFIIYLSCYLVLAPHFYVYLFLKGGPSDRSRPLDW